MKKRHQSTHKIVCWRFTRKCNRSCKFCLSNSGPKISHPKRNVKLVVKRLYDIGVKKISYSGGEPLLNPDLYEAVNLATKLGISQIITSNGDMLLSKRLNSLIDNFEYIKISFYGDQVEHDRLMGIGHYNELLEKVKIINKRGHSIGANFMLTNQSEHLLDKFLIDAANAGIENVLILTYIPTGEEEIDFKFNRKSLQLEKLIDKTSAYSHLFSGGIKIHNYTNTGFFIVIDEHDNVTIPGKQRNSPHVLGNIFDSFLMTSNGHFLPIRTVMEMIWANRFETKAIIPV